VFGLFSHRDFWSWSVEPHCLSLGRAGCCRRAGRLPGATARGAGGEAAGQAEWLSGGRWARLQPTEVGKGQPPAGWGFGTVVHAWRALAVAKARRGLAEESRSSVEGQRGGRR